jgi:thiol:disulfide interchange protein DsbD
MQMLPTRLFYSQLGFTFAIFWGLAFPDFSRAQSTSPTAPPAQTKEESPLRAQAFLTPTRLEPQQIAELRLLIQLKPGFKAFEDQFRLKILKPAGFKIAQVKVSPTKEFYDKFSKKTRKGVIDSAQLIAAVEAPLELEESTAQLELQLTYQACTDAFCLFPEDILLTAPLNFVGPVQKMSLPKSTDGSMFNEKFDQIYSQGLWITFFFVFIFGILTSFTPCIFPMIPITLAVLGKEAHARTHGQNILVSLIYVLGIATTYSLLGLLAASTGSLFGSFMAHPVVLGFMCLVFFAMAISMLGGFDLQAPNSLQNDLLKKVRLHGYGGVFVTGILAGVVASPCVGPVLVGILTFVARTQNLWLGFWLLFVYAVGMGQIFILLGVSARAKKLLPKSGAWMDGVKHFLGLLMLGVFFYYLDFLVPARIWDAIFGIGLILFASLMGAFSPLPQTNKKLWPATRKGLLFASLIVGAAFVSISVVNARQYFLKFNLGDRSEVRNSQWQTFSEDLFQKAVRENRPVIIDFWADWCAACHQLEEETFSNQRVQLLGTEFVKLKFDATQSSEELERLKLKYKIVGLPTIVFHDRQGQWAEDLTLTEFEEPTAFIERMRKSLQR